jgi:hypothetical protein
LMLCLMMAFMAVPSLAQQVTGSWSEELVVEPPQDISQISLQYSQYYQIEPGGQPAGAERFSISGQEPKMLYVGPEQKSLSYSQYQTYATATGGNALWIQGTGSWTQYAQVPLGSSLSLIATTPSGGGGYLYEIYPSGELDKNYYYFYPYTRIGFYADTIGQHILLFVVNNQASNAVVVDVTGYYPGPAPTPSPVPGPSYGMARVNIVSSWLTGYEVYVDDVYQFTEGQGGIPDGYCSFTVTGNANHKITIRKGGYYYSQTRYFASGGEYTLRIN